MISSTKVYYVGLISYYMDFIKGVLEKTKKITPVIITTNEETGNIIVLSKTPDLKRCQAFLKKQKEPYLSLIVYTDKYKDEPAIIFETYDQKVYYYFKYQIKDDESIEFIDDLIRIEK